MSRADLAYIAIVGPESTGKSTLSAQLARHYHSSWVEEYAREYLTHLKRPYRQSDLIDIAKGQLRQEQIHAKSANKLLFCDTNLLVIKIWSEYKYGICDPWIQNNMELERYHLHLLTDIDLPWEDDELREHPYAREELFNIYHQSLVDADVPFKIISGDRKERIKSAVQAIDRSLVIV